MSDAIADRFEREFRPKIDHHIATSGVTVQGVFASKGEPAYLYTIGLHERAHPEILISCMTFDAAHHALMQCYRRHRCSGALPLDTVLDDILPGVPMQLRAVHSSNLARFGIALRYYRNPASFEGLQLFWPDPDSGAWPWDEGRHRYQQHRLDLPRAGMA